MANIVETSTVTSPSRFNVIDMSQLGVMRVLEDLDSEATITARMLKFKEVWTEHDPPAGAIYDVENLEFDPIRIAQECNTYFEDLLRDRINQAARAVTLAYAISTDLDAIATRYPVGPRLPIVPSPRDYAQFPQDYESDARYRRRTQLSVNALSPHGASGAYMYWALTADPNLRDASESTIEGTGEITITCMDDNPSEPRPSQARLLAIRAYIMQNFRKSTTDVITVAPPLVIEVPYKIRVWFFPPPDKDSLLAILRTALDDLVENQRWLGYDHTRMAIFGALKQNGVHHAEIDSPAADVFVDARACVKVTSIELTYMGRSE